MLELRSRSSPRKLASNLLPNLTAFITWLRVQVFCVTGCLFLMSPDVWNLEQDLSLITLRNKTGKVLWLSDHIGILCNVHTVLTTVPPKTFTGSNVLRQGWALCHVVLNKILSCRWTLEHCTSGCGIKRHLGDKVFFFLVWFCYYHIMDSSLFAIAKWCTALLKWACLDVHCGLQVSLFTYSYCFKSFICVFTLWTCYIDVLS